MKRILFVALAALMGLSLIAPQAADAAKERVQTKEVKKERVVKKDNKKDTKKVVKKEKVTRRERTTVVVRQGHPIRRRLPTVIVRRPNVAVRVKPAVFLPIVVWRPLIVARPAHDLMVWQDAETLDRYDGWTETYFDSDQRGSRLFLEVRSGRVQFDFAEVVFANGDTRVVDFSNGTRGPGLYSLLDFRDGRRVDHVRLIARAKTMQARVVLIMEK